MIFLHTFITTSCSIILHFGDPIPNYSRLKGITFLSILDPTASRDQAVAHPDPGRSCTAACSPPWVPIGVAEPGTSALLVDSDEESDTEDKECERCERLYYYGSCTHTALSFILQYSRLLPVRIICSSV